MNNRNCSKESKLYDTNLDAFSSRGYQSAHMQKDQVISQLKKQGFRITKQRKILIDIILNEDCSCCKEVYVLAAKKDPGIDIATVYRTMDALEQAGALKRRSAYELRIEKCEKYQGCLVELEDGSTVTLDRTAIEKVIEQGMHKYGLSDGKRIRGITLLQMEKGL